MCCTPLSRVRYSDSLYYLDGAIAAMAETLLNKLKSVEQTFNELNRRPDPDIATNPTGFNE